MLIVLLSNKQGCKELTGPIRRPLNRNRRSMIVTKRKPGDRAGPLCRRPPSQSSSTNSSQRLALLASARLSIKYPTLVAWRGFRKIEIHLDPPVPMIPVWPSYLRMVLFLFLVGFSFHTYIPYILWHLEIPISISSPSTQTEIPHHHQNTSCDSRDQ